MALRHDQLVHSGAPAVRNRRFIGAGALNDINGLVYKGAVVQHWWGSLTGKFSIKHVEKCQISTVKILRG